MRSIFAFALTAIFLSANVAAQDSDPTPEQQCAVKCGTDAIPASGCTADDQKCLCASTTFLPTVIPCAVKCGITEEEAKAGFADGCDDTGDDDPDDGPGNSQSPEPSTTAKSGSSTPPPSSTAKESNTSKPTQPSATNTQPSATKSDPPKKSNAATEMNVARGGGSVAAALGLVFALL